MLDEVLAVAAVDSDLADARVCGGDLVQEVGADNGILHASRGHQHTEYVEGQTHPHPLHELGSTFLHTGRTQHEALAVH